MKKFIAVTLLFSSLFLIGCDTNDNTASNNHITQNIEITNSDDALSRLKNGNTRFINDESALINVNSERRNEISDEQNPHTIVVSCSDSRVTPTTIFNVGLGEIFDVRLAGNVVDADALGSIEYGALHLNCPLIVVMGHEKCGAVTAAYDKLHKGTEVEGNINSIVDKIEPVIKESHSLDEAIEENVDSVAEQIEEDVLLKDLIDSNKLKLVKAIYSLDGKVRFYD